MCDLRVLALMAALALHAGVVDAVAVMSVDLGSEWMKIAVVSPGVPMEIALNVESKRKTPTAVAFRDGTRTFGEEALNVGVKFPSLCYKHFLDLLGKNLEHPLVKDFQTKFPYYNLEADSRGVVVFRHNETTTYSPEELLGMILSHATFIAEHYSNQKVKDVVITVPAFFSQAERRAVLAAAALARVHVLQLINEHMAVALNYGMFRRKELNTTAKNIMFYNMGASQSWASVVSFALVKTKERGFAETHPQAQVLGLGIDRTLGGLDLQLKVQDMMADKFAAVKKTQRDPRQVARAMGKMFKESAKVKLVLSANKDYTAQIENVLDDEDLRIPFTRDEFEEANRDFFGRVVKPIERALGAANMALKEIDQIILFGGSTRVPGVQRELEKFLGRDLGKSLNTDEAAAMGAVYSAADRSSGFKVKKFITRDVTLYPVDVDFKRRTEEGQVKVVKRTLFGLMNNYPQRKVMTFNKFTDDFSFNVNYGTLDHLQGHERTWLGGLNLSEVRVSKVKEAFEKNRQDNVEPKGVKAHFNMDESGILTLETVEAVFEKNVSVAQQIEEEKARAAKEEVEAKAKEVDETWARLGDKISSLWGGGGGEKEEEEKKKEEDKKEEGAEDKNGKKEDKKDKEGEKKKEEKTKKKEAPKKDIITTLKEPLEAVLEVRDLENLSNATREEYTLKLQLWEEHDRAILQRATAFNDLESYVIDMQAKLYEDVYEKSSTEEERERIAKKCSEISDWLYMDYSDETEIRVLEDKLQEIKNFTADLRARVRELHDRPEAMEALKSMLNSSQHFYGKAVNSTAVVDGFFSQAELDALGKLLNKTAEWVEEAEKTVAEQPMHEMPKITASKVAEKALQLDREVNYLVNKAKIAKRKSDEAAAAEKAKKAAEELKKAAEELKKEKEKKEGAKEDSSGDEETAKEEVVADKKDDQEKVPKEEAKDAPGTEAEDVPVAEAEGSDSSGEAESTPDENNKEEL